jgi:hypothetical protein
MKAAAAVNSDMAMYRYEKIAMARRAHLLRYMAKMYEWMESCLPNKREKKQSQQRLPCSKIECSGDIGGLYQLLIIRED